MKSDWKKFSEVYDELRKAASHFPVPVIVAKQQKRPPGFGPLAPERKPGEADLIIIDYPDMLR